ncbi:MAG: hypothetical protein AB7K24_01830 [Gemmataceae bacterium]
MNHTLKQLAEYEWWLSQEKHPPGTNVDFWLRKSGLGEIEGDPSFPALRHWVNRIGGVRAVMDLLVAEKGVPAAKVEEMTLAQAVAKLTAEPAGPGEQLTIDTQALALFLDDPTRTKRDIAKLLGKPRPHQTLSKEKCPKLNAAMNAHKAPQRKPKRGSKDRNGNLEALADE